MPENTEKSVKDTEKSVNVAEKPAKADKAAKAEKSEKKDNAFVRFFKNTAKFLRDVKSEIKKIVWPAPKSVFKNTGVVLVTIIIIGLFIFGLDTAFMNLLGLIMNIAK
ncbi:MULTISPECIES: preprotein translocase subunit SecE [Eubacteriales]|uniref:preprotein translocase subunit SecE n=1 Tax=Eubacteriales TaxID=186802 RepID=UPI00093DB73C|nr:MULTISPECIES: preprotein translocase subunit SecE [Eubacteriales]